ncbi:MAG: septum formation initiator family protein [Clostridiales bacterium]|nr:septum formation initiator family protein [Clostridiales bacterium]
MVQRATRESVAYDYARFDSRRSVRRAAEISEKPLNRTRKKRKSVISFSMAASYFMVLLVSGIIVFNYMQVTMLSDQKVKLEKQIETLKNEETGLRAQKEKMYNLNYIEEYAKNKLHMVKADKSQYSYIEMSEPDQIKIIKNEKEGVSNYFSGFVKSFNVVMEYLN